MGAEQMTNILNISFLAIIAFSALMGSFKGFHKSIFQLVMALVFFILAVLLIPLIAEAVLGMNIGFIKGFLPIEGEIPGNSIKEIIPALLQSNFSSQQAMFVEGSETMALIFGIIKLVLILVLFVLYFFFAMTFIKIITMILYQFVKPDKKKVKKRKLTGALVGAGRGVMVVLLLAIPLVGLSSIYESTNKITTYISSNGEENTENVLEEFAFLRSYNDTWVAKTLGGMGGQRLDEGMFDFVFKIETKINGKTESIKIRKDLENGAAIYETIMKASEGKLNEELLFKLTDEDITAIQNNLDNTDLLKIVQAIAAEAVYSYVIDLELDRDYEELLTLSNLKAIDLKQDVITILEIAKMINEMDFGGDIEDNIFIFDEEQLDEIVDTIVTIEWLKYGLPLGLNFALSNESMKEMMIQYQIDSADIEKPTETELLLDIENIKAIYAILQDIGITNLKDFDNIMESEFIEDLTDEDVEEIVDAIFGFNTLDKNKKMIAALIHSSIANNESFGAMIDKDHFMLHFNKEEIKHIMVVVKVLLDSGMMSDESSTQIQDFLTDANIDKLANRISRSEILSHSMEGLLETMLSGVNLPYTIEIPDDVTFRGVEGEAEIKSLFKAARFIMDPDFEIGELNDDDIDEVSTLLAGSKIMRHNITPMLSSTLSTGMLSSFVIHNTRDDWTKDEIYYTIKSYGIFANELENISNISAFSNSKIDEIADTLSKSKTIRDNISPMLSNFTEGTTFDFIKPTYPQEHWTKDEIYYTLSGLQIFDFNTVSTETINGIEDTDIEILARSITLSDILEQEIEKMTLPDGILNGNLLFVSDLVWHSTATESGELEYFLKGIKETLGVNPLSGYAPNIDELFDKDVDKVFKSKLLEKTLVENHIIPLTTGSLSEYLEEKDRDGDDFIWLKDESGNSDSVDFVKALRDLMGLGIDYTDINLSSIQTTLNQPVDPSEDPMTVQVEQAFMQSRIFMHSMNKLMDKVTGGNPGNILPYDANTDWENGGLLNVLEALKTM